MIDINSIIHLESEAFDVEKDMAFLCVKDYQFNNNAHSYKFQKDNIYSIAFAKSVGVTVSKYTLTNTTQKHCFKRIEKKNIQTPFVNIQNLQPQAEPEEKLQETQYRFEVSGYRQKDGSAFRKNQNYSETEIKEAGLDIEELFEKEAITWLK